MNCDVDTRMRMYWNIVLSGWTLMCTGINNCIEKEMIQLVPPTMKIVTITPTEPKCSLLVGNSILASLSTFQEKWITTEGYDEYCNAIIHRKCSFKGVKGSN